MPFRGSASAPPRPSASSPSLCAAPSREAAARDSSSNWRASLAFAGTPVPPRSYISANWNSICASVASPPGSRAASSSSSSLLVSPPPYALTAARNQRAAFA
eukprot:scaffold3356_cov112-Isochrysis_galbana.AAC.7